MPETWMKALRQYSYKADLSTFEDRRHFSGAFQRRLDPGDKLQTVEFEDHFRRNAERNIDVWVEVVYWKLYSQPRVRNGTTRRIADRLAKEGIAGVFHACKSYVDQPSRDSFSNLQSIFAESRAIAVAATFPAFFDPGRYPMVDTRIAKWVGSFKDSHNNADRSAPELIEPPFLSNSATVLTMSDYGFMESWIQWCRHMAIKLTGKTCQQWRARDVEMAVFTAQGKNLNLNPLAGC